MKIDAQYVNMLKSTLLIRTALHTNERVLVAQTFTLGVIFSTRPLHSIFVSLLAVMGTPRYFSGKEHSESPITSRHFVWRSSGVPLKTIWGF